MNATRFQFERSGLGYISRVHDRGIAIRLDGIKQKSDGLYGVLTVEQAGGHDDPTLVRSRFNVSSMTTRKTMASYLGTRANGRAGDVQWLDLIEMFCRRVMQAEEEGEGFEQVGTMPEKDVKRATLLLDPFLPLGKPSTLFAGGGTGKSLLAAVFAVSVVAGRAIIPGISPSRSGAAIYLDWETDRTETDDRVKAVCKGAAIPRVELVYMHCRRPLTELVEIVARRVDEEDAALVIVDSAALAAGISGENADANDSTLRYFDALRHIGGTSLTLDHVTKRDSGGQPYGSAYKTNLSRAVWEMRTVPRVGDPVSHVALHHRKANTTALREPIGLAMTWMGDAVSVRQEPVLTAEPAYPETTTQADRIADLILETGHPLDYPEIAKALDLPENTVRAQLSRHKDRFQRVPGGWKVVVN